MQDVPGLGGWADGEARAQDVAEEMSDVDVRKPAPLLALEREWRTTAARLRNQCREDKDALRLEKCADELGDRLVEMAVLPFEAGGQMGTPPGQRVTPDNMALLPAGSVVRNGGRASDAGRKLTMCDEAPVDDLVGHLSSGLAGKKDAIISEVLDRELGAGWKYAEIRTRGTMTTYPNGREVFSIDGKPLLEFWPVELTEEKTEMGWKIHASQRYRAL